jgi:hypothetical protein
MTVLYMLAPQASFFTQLAARAFFNFMLIRSSERFVLPRDSDYP